MNSDLNFPVGSNPNFGMYPNNESVNSYSGVTNMNNSSSQMYPNPYSNNNSIGNGYLNNQSGSNIQNNPNNRYNSASANFNPNSNYNSNQNSAGFIPNNNNPSTTLLYADNPNSSGSANHMSYIIPMVATFCGVYYTKRRSPTALNDACMASVLSGVGSMAYHYVLSPNTNNYTEYTNGRNDGNNNGFQIGYNNGMRFASSGFKAEEDSDSDFSDN